MRFDSEIYRFPQRYPSSRADYLPFVDLRCCGSNRSRDVAAIDDTRRLNRLRMPDTTPFLKFAYNSNTYLFAMDAQIYSLLLKRKRGILPLITLRPTSQLTLASISNSIDHSTYCCENSFHHRPLFTQACTTKGQDLDLTSNARDRSTVRQI